MNDGVTGVDQAADQICLIQEICILLIKAANGHYSTQTEGAIRHHVWETGREREIELRRRPFPTGVGSPHAIGSAKAPLIGNTSVVEKEAARGRYYRVGERPQNLRQPLRFWDRIIIEKGNNVACRHCQANIARLGQITCRAMGGPDAIGPFLDEFFGSVGCGPVNNANFEVGKVEMAKAFERLGKALGAPISIDNNRDTT